MVLEHVTRLTRRILVGKEQTFVFSDKRPRIPSLQKTDLYIHIPFCKSLCPYCPYNRIAYTPALVQPYLDAILLEIALYRRIIGRAEIGSIYIGGGTPTTMIDELAVMLDTVRKTFHVTGDVCVETSPANLDDIILKKLRAMGVSLLSIGIQSFRDEYLTALGRTYTAAVAERAITRAMAAGFSSVNIDLMFVLPGQSVSDIVFDLEKAISLGVDQITTYPLFTFPYTSVGTYKKLNKVRMPNFINRRLMYKKIHKYCVEKGYARVSVWGFKKGAAPRYSSVTRDHYVGLGAGAGSRFPNVFYFNTFSVPEYISTLAKNTLPIAISMDVTPALARQYWLYWRLYDTYIGRAPIETVFGSNNLKIRLLFGIFRLLGLCRIKNDEIELTRRGSFYIHLLQNYFILNYINKVWTVCKKDPWPKRIAI